MAQRTIPFKPKMPMSVPGLGGQRLLGFMDPVRRAAPNMLSSYYGGSTGRFMTGYEQGAAGKAFGFAKGATKWDRFFGKSGHIAGRAVAGFKSGRYGRLLAGGGALIGAAGLAAPFVGMGGSGAATLGGALYGGALAGEMLGQKFGVLGAIGGAAAGAVLGGAAGSIAYGQGSMRFATANRSSIKGIKG